MRVTRGAVLLVFLLALGAQRLARATDVVVVGEDEQRLKALKLEVDGGPFLAFFRARTNPAVNPSRMAALVRDMGNDSDKVSVQAMRDLAGLGSVTVPWLRRALKDPDDSLAVVRAGLLLHAIEGAEGADLPAAAARLVAIRRPAGAVKVLLAYLPFADDETVVEEVRDALKALAVVDGTADPVLVAALKDDLPIRRAVAAEALCMGKASGELPAINYLLRDPKASVRLRTALALAAAKENAAIPVLIELLGKLPEAQAAPAQAILTTIAGEQAPAVALGKDEATRKVCRDRWNTWWQAIKDGDLIDYFRKRTLTDGDRAKYQRLVAQMGSDSYRIRQKAVRDLAAYRAEVVPMLMETMRDTSRDLEIRRNAEECLKIINNAPGAALSAANARVIAYRKPPGALEVLLAYLPFADDETVSDEVRGALAVLAVPDGKPHKSLLAALSDKSPARRVAAVEALLMARVPPRESNAAELLKDPDLSVRLRTAIAFAGAREKAGVPVLIDLLAQGPFEESVRAEEALRRLADDKAPSASIGNDEETRKKCRAAWAAWWKERGPKIEMAEADAPPRLHGYTLIAQYTNNGSGQVVEIGKDGKKRWSIEGLSYSFDMQVLRGERLLVPEYSANRVTERDFKGKVIWELGVQNPINAQRLPNGNTFVAGRNRIFEVDRNKKEVFAMDRPQHDVMAAQKLRNGQIAIISSGGQLIRMDAKGKVIKQFGIGQVNYYGGLEALANGHVLVSEYSANRVVQYNAEGKTVWQATVQLPSSATRLPNGNTLVASQDSNMVVEVDRKGKKVWEHRTDGRPWRVRRR